MVASTITSKGQITIPAIVRSKLNVGPGDRIEFVQISDYKFEIIPATRDVKTLRGIIKTNKTVSIKEMNNAIMEEAG